MSDSLSKIYEDYDSYIILCNRLRIESLPLRVGDSSWYKHFVKLDKQIKNKKDEKNI